MMIDWTVSVGNILTMVGFFGGGLLFVLTMRADIKLISQRLTEVEKDLSQITNVIVEIARQSERLTAQDRRMNDISNRLFRVETRMRMTGDGGPLLSDRIPE